MKKVLITILLMAFYLVMNAQSNFKEGYVVTLKGDTIHGAIKWQNDVMKSERCIFKDVSDNIKIYHPDDIAAYGFERGKYFVTRFARYKKEVKRVFAEYLVKGKKSLYYFRDRAGFHYLLSYKKDTIIEIPFRERDVYVTDKGSFEGPPLQTGFLKLYFKDEPSLYNEIDNIHELGFNNLIALTKKYNQLVCGNNCYKVYYKEPSIKLGFELRVGIEHLKGATRRMYLPQFGGLLYLGLPRANRRIALKTGILYYGYPGETSYPEVPRFEIITVPLQFEYTFNKNPRFIPKIDFGINYFMEHYPDNGGFTDKILTLAGGAGAFFKISKSVYFDLSLDSDILAFQYNTQFFYTYTLSGGIYYKF